MSLILMTEKSKIIALLCLVLCYRLKSYEERCKNDTELLYTTPTVCDEEPEPAKKKLRSSSEFRPSATRPGAQATRCPSLLSQQALAVLLVCCASVQHQRSWDQNCLVQFSLHAFTGCDSVSSFKGKGKVKPFQLMQEKKEFLQTFRLLGCNWDLTADLLQRLERFVCCLYGQKTCSCVNEARVNIFSSTGKFDSTLPPCQDSLKLHATRANYQAAVWRH